jgi:hypothetical protein
MSICLTKYHAMKTYPIRHHAMEMYTVFITAFSFISPHCFQKYFYFIWFWFFILISPFGMPPMFYSVSWTLTEEVISLILWLHCNGEI